MVYIIDSDWCSIGYELIRLRNILFTAITRSRAWVRLCGVGDGMISLQQEIQKVIDNNYKLSFKIPTKDELKTIRLINRDRTDDEKNKIQKAKKSIKEIQELIDSGILSPEMMPELKFLIKASKIGDSWDD